MSPTGRPKRTIKPTQRRREAEQQGLLRPAKATGVNGAAKAVKAVKATKAVKAVKAVKAAKVVKAVKVVRTVKAVKAVKVAKATKSTPQTGNAAAKNGAQPASAPGPRRSLRPRKPAPAPAPKKTAKAGSSRKPDDANQKLLRDSLASIYQEIDEYARQDTSQFWTPAELKILDKKVEPIRQILRQARMIRSLDQIQTQRHGLVINRLHSFQSSNTKVSQVVAKGNADWNLPVVFQTRLKEFFGRQPNFVVLSICAHSNTFRDALFRLDADSQAQSLPKWGQLSPMIQANASSLELFAEVRGLAWEAALDHANDHFGLLLKHVFVGNHTMTNDATGNRDSITNSGNFGIKSTDATLVHSVPRKEREPGLWTLPLDPTKAASRNEAQVITTKKTLAEFKKTNPRLRLYSPVTVVQADIEESILLPGYDEIYPEWIKPRDKRRPVDPRFDGRKEAECMVCGKKATAKSTREKTRPCTCNFTDLRRWQWHDNHALYELADTGRIGTGVRALQDLMPGTYLGEYVGEVYPPTDETVNDESVGRYGKGQYIYLMNITGDPNIPEQEKTYNVDAAKLGNWTRYVNHSCKPNTEFIPVTIGHLQYVAVKAIRPVEFGQQLTVDYGDIYFQGFDYGCKCGLSTCRRWVEEITGMGGPRAATLQSAKRVGKAPQWAMDDDNVPFDKPIAKSDLNLPTATGTGTGTKRSKQGGNDGQGRPSKRQRR